jgi:hypothetical protein
MKRSPLLLRYLYTPPKPVYTPLQCQDAVLKLFRLDTVWADA